jgi:hypothetical protein
LISNESKKISSNRNKAMASATSNPRAKARTKSAPFCKAPVSCVDSDVYSQKKRLSEKKKKERKKAFPLPSKFTTYSKFHRSRFDIHSYL